MKILHVAETIQGGVATIVDQLICVQVEQGHHIQVLIPSDQTEHLSQSQHIVSYKKTGRNFFSFIILAWCFFIQIFHFKPDIIHIHSSFAGAICRAILFFCPFIKVKVVYCPHSFAFMMQVSEKKKKLYSSIEKIMLLVTDQVICVGKSEYEAALYYGLNPKKLTLIYNGVNELKDVDLTQKKYLKNSTLHILFVGRFDYQKGFDLLTQLFQYTMHLNVQFTVVGDFVHANTQQKSCFPHVTYTGWIPKHQLAQYYEHADLMIMPSRWEGLPMVALEAFSMGVPLFASNCPSLAEIIDKDEDGYLFENNSIESLINKFDYVYQNIDQHKLMAMSHKVRHKYLHQFTAQQMLNSTMVMYEDLVH